MDVFVAGFGLLLLVIATLLSFRGRRRASVGRAGLGLPAAVLVALLLSSTTAYAEHDRITPSTYWWIPPQWNGYKVYLSSPTHIESGAKGECGWEENINGRYFNYYAASVFTQSAGSFYDRGYSVQVSGNPRDDSYVSHVDEANNWGAQIYIVTHTNGIGSGCPQTPSYLRVMYDSTVSYSLTLKNMLVANLDPVTPGGESPASCELTFHECWAPWAWYRAYVELFFHTNVAATNWFQGGGFEGEGGVTESWRYGYSVDVILGFPR